MRLASALALLSPALPATGSALAPIERRSLLKGAAAASTISAAPALAKGSAGGPKRQALRRHAVSRGQLRPASL